MERSDLSPAQQGVCHFSAQISAEWRSWCEPNGYRYKQLELQNKRAAAPVDYTLVIQFYQAAGASSDYTCSQSCL